MPRKQTAKFKCPKCGKSFRMAMHLGRHMTTMHGQSAKQSTPLAKPKAMPKGDTGRALIEMINDLQTQRQEHVDAIATIDEVFTTCGIQPQERRRPGRPPGRKAGKPVAAAAAVKDIAGRKGQRRTRRKFAVSGLDSVMGFVKSTGKKGATTTEIVAHWKSEGRSGNGYTTLTQLVKEKKLTKEKLKGAKGSRYKAA